MRHGANLETLRRGIKKECVAVCKLSLSPFSDSLFFGTDFALGVGVTSKIPFILGLLTFFCIICVSPATDLKQHGSRVARFVPSGWPVLGKLSSDFGLRRHLFHHTKQFHQGVDIAGALQSPVHATATGQVKWSGLKGSYGWSVAIEHGHGWETLYAHLQSSSLKQGDTVLQGEKIGALGQSGRATGPHLHYEIHYLGEAINPLHYIGGLTAGSVRPEFSQLAGWSRGASFHLH